MSAVPARAWLTVGLLWVVAALNYLDRIMLITMHRSITKAIPMTDAQFGLLTTAFLLVYGVLSPLGGFLADRVSRSRVIVFSLVAWSAATWLTAHSTTFGELLATRAMMGVSEAAYLPAACALIMDYHRDATRSLANGLHLSGVMVGSGLGGLGGWLAERHGWAYAFDLFGFVGAGYAILLVFLLRDVPSAERGAGPIPPPAAPVRLGEALRSLFRRPAFVLAVLFWGGLGLTSWAFIGWIPTYLSENFHLAQGKAGLLAMGYVYSGSLVGMIVGGAWADRWSLTNKRGRVLVGVIGLMLAVPGILLAADARLLAFALAGLALYGFTRIFADANMAPIVCQIADSRYQATGLGVLNAFAVFCGGATIYAGGALRDARVNIGTVFNFGAVGLFACAVLLWFIKPCAPAVVAPA